MSDSNQIETVTDTLANPNLNDRIQNSLLKYYKLSDDKQSLERKDPEEPLGAYEFDIKNDKLRITSVSISSILSGKWIPAAFNNGRIFKAASTKGSYSYKSEGKKQIVTAEQVGRLIVNQLKIAFKDLELEIPEA